jgi:hypothetical protein
LATAPGYPVSTTSLLTHQHTLFYSFNNNPYYISVYIFSKNNHLTDEEEGTTLYHYIEISILLMKLQQRHTLRGGITKDTYIPKII